MQTLAEIDRTIADIRADIENLRKLPDQSKPIATASSVAEQIEISWGAINELAFRRDILVKYNRDPTDDEWRAFYTLARR